MTKKTNFIMIRTSAEEKALLEKLAKVEGCSTLTQFCRQRLFQSLSTDIKLNQILNLLNSNGGKDERAKYY